jgi:hypothetical protein
MGQAVRRNSQCIRLDIPFRGEYLWYAGCNILFGARFKSVRASLATWNTENGPAERKINSWYSWRFIFREC